MDFQSCGDPARLTHRLTHLCDKPKRDARVPPGIGTAAARAIRSLALEMEREFIVELPIESSLWDTAI